MESLKVLVNEHVAIHRCLDHMSKAADNIVHDKFPPMEFFEKALHFCRNYSDKYHHYKEEYLMFGYLAQMKNGEIDAQIESHRSQHEHCRNLIQQMSEHLDGYSNKRNESTRALHRNISDYVKTLRSHIKSENDIFFPLVNHSLSSSDDKILMDEFKKYENKVDKNVHDINQKLLDEMQALLEPSS